MAISHRIHVWCIYLLLVDCYGKCRLIYHTRILWVWVCLKIRKPLKSILFLPKQTISRRLGRCLEILETYVNKIPNTSFSSALKKAASRARIKEGRTACKQTLQSAVHLHAPPSQDSGGKWRSLCKLNIFKILKWVEIFWSIQNIK